MRKVYKFVTRVGPFYLATQADRWHVLFEDDSLGSYLSTAHAIDDLCGGHTFSPGGNIDTSELGIPDELSEWERCSEQGREE